MKKLLILGLFVVAGLMMSSCCNDYDCLIEKYSNTDDPTEMAEIANKMIKLQSEGKQMTMEQQVAYQKVIVEKQVKMQKNTFNMDDSK